MIGQAGLNTYDRTYFNDGNVATENNNEYSYDGMSRLSSENNTDFTFDIFSNRETKDTTSYTYDKNNRLLSDSSSLYSYDDNGNRLTKGNSSYSWDSFNRLISADGITYTYDGHGLMQTKTDSSGTTRFIYDGANIVAEIKNDVATTYSRGLSLISRDDGTAKEYYHFNPHGDVVNLTNASGATIATYTYDAFGNITSQTGSSTNNFKYCGEWSDPDTGLLYLRARWYDSSVGAFINEDPIRSGLNWYLYCGGNPLNRRDPSGLYYVALREEAEKHGFSVSYDADTRTASIDGTGVAFTASEGSTTYIDNSGKMQVWINDDTTLVDYVHDHMAGVENNREDWVSYAGYTAAGGAAYAAGVGIYKLGAAGVAKIATWLSPAALVAPEYVKDAGSFISWTQQAFEKTHETLNLSQVQQLFIMAQQYGIEISADLSGHTGTAWEAAHIHLGNARVHIEVAKEAIEWIINNLP